MRIIGIISGVLIASVAAVLIYRSVTQQDSENIDHPSRRISAEEAHAKMQENPNALILDVRSEAEFLTGRIPGAVLIPHTDIEANEHLLPSDRDSLILVYCQRGIRTIAATETLLRMGFTNVFDFGAITDWQHGIER